MALVALVVWALYFALARLRRLVVMRRRTGEWLLRITPGAGRVIGSLFPYAYALVVLGTVLDLAGGLGRVAMVEGPAAQAIGLVLAVAGLPLILVAQQT